MDTGRPVSSCVFNPPTRVELCCGHPGCQRQILLEPEEAVALVGPHLTFAAAQRRLKCTGCGWTGRDGRITLRPYMVDFYDQRHGHGRFAPGEMWAPWAETKPET